MPSDHAISLTNVCVDVPSFQILRNIDWQLPYGARAVVLGPNGSGKSTLLKTITAYGHITSGQAVVLGETIGRTEVHRLRRRMGIVDPTLIRLLDRSVTAQQLVSTGFYGHLTTFFDRPTSQELDCARSVLDEVGLDDRANQLVSTLSSGQRSRVWLARALVHHPQLLVLDEPTADLDLLGRETLSATLDLIARQRPDLTMISVTHHLEDLLPDTDELLLLGEGRIVAQGSPTDVLTSEHLSQAFGCEVHVHTRNGRWHWSVPRNTWHRLTDEYN